jgi:hypothetical protein
MIYDQASPRLPQLQSGFRKERLGSVVSYHLRNVTESTSVNVGGPYVESAVLDEA